MKLFDQMLDRPRLSGGSGAGVKQSAGTDQGRLVPVVFSAADKGPSVSAVVQLTSDEQPVRTKSR